MAYDEGLAQRVREMLAGHPFLDEKKMFGGIGFLIQGNMACGVKGLSISSGDIQWDLQQVWMLPLAIFSLIMLLYSLPFAVIGIITGAVGGRVGQAIGRFHGEQNEYLCSNWLTLTGV